ncbi:MAG: TIGR03862 family flavoprotein [Ilumatobacter fluminis]|uniref:NAD(P)/FAD-dependent oxidoreductase n=1 Tax=Ilumatobacter fluminis TaxID=467091 RepID=UPI0032EFC82D
MAATAAVIGGGPAGLIAAERLVASGAEVTVYDHAPSVGRKFLLAGRGGLNITHAEPFEQFVTRYGDAADHLRPSLEAFPPDALRAWCAGLGQPTFAGSSGRVFPEAFRATPLLRAWLARLASGGVRLEPRTRWVGWTDDGGVRLGTPDGDRIEHPGATVLALGGASWPRVGSDGGWVDTFLRAGIDVAPLRAANVRVLVGWTSWFVRQFAGEPLKNVALTVGERTVRGEPVVTEHGLEGGPVYALGDLIRDDLDEHGTATLTIDLAPDLAADQLDERLGRRERDSTSTRLKRAGLHAVAVNVLREATSNDLPTDHEQLAALIKAVPLRVSGTASIDRAISSAGGVRWSELDEHLMLRRRPGTFVSGEMIDWEAPTGGYLLQACFSTGRTAGDGAAAWLNAR